MVESSLLVAGEPLEPGDHVWFPGYGVGVVESVSEFRLYIDWERAGSLDHDPSFVRHLERR